jgi:hypothetical protein
MEREREKEKGEPRRRGAKPQIAQITGILLELGFWFLADHVVDADAPV